MRVNLISPKGEKISVRVSLLFFLNRSRVKAMIEKGYILASEEDANLVSKLGIF